jgi:hypothetical protein
MLQALANGTADAPTLANPIDDLSTDANVAFTFQVPASTFVDYNPGDTLAYIATLADGSPLPSWLSLDAATGTFNGTPHFNDLGTHSIKLTAIDIGNKSVSDTFDLSVAGINHAPTVGAPLSDQSVDADAFVQIQVPFDTFADSDTGDSLVYSATLGDDFALPGWLYFDAPNATFYEFAENSNVGDYNIKLTATDTGGLSISDVFTLRVAPTYLTLTGDIRRRYARRRQRERYLVGGTGERLSLW